MSTARLHCVLFGHGRMGSLHAAKLQARDDIELSIVDPAAGWTDPPPRAPDFAIIATPTHTHTAIALDLLERSVPCLVEKPLCADVHEARQLAQYPHLSVGHIERFNPAFAAVRGCRPRFLQAERIAPPSGRSTDVDVIADLMIHDIDLALQLMPGKLVDVRATGVGVVSGSADIVEARLEFLQADGQTAVASLTASRVSRRAARTLRLVESGVYWTVDLAKAQVQRIPWGEGDLQATTVDVPQQDALENQLQAFIAAVRGETEYPCSGADGLRALLLAERIRSAVEG